MFEKSLHDLQTDVWTHIYHIHSTGCVFILMYVRTTLSPLAPSVHHMLCHRRQPMKRYSYWSHLFDKDHLSPLQSSSTKNIKIFAKHQIAQTVIIDDSSSSSREKMAHTAQTDGNLTVIDLSIREIEKATDRKIDVFDWSSGNWMGKKCEYVTLKRDLCMCDCIISSSFHHAFIESLKLLE